MNTMFTKQRLVRSLIVIQLVGYAALLFLIAGDELFDLPHTVFGTLATPVNWPEIVIESSYIIVLAAVSLTLTKILMGRIRFFEGYVPICAYCKKIRNGDEWCSLEAYVTAHSEALFSHGICPECRESHFGHQHHPDGVR
ncbi:MAG: hypothetical protein HUU02_00230 [Bacteroidetes bacterium]|nr:hypothetical protein [Bacteroidota bacterium]